jgi:hypothetical protein
MSGHRRFIEKHLGKLELGPQREEEILRELSEHVADHAAALEARGVARDAAAQQAFDSVSNWPELRNEIVSAETEEAIMNYRTKVVWLPAFCTFTLSMVLLALLQISGLRPSFFWSTIIPIHLPWLITLPVIGAVGAYWSMRAGGRLSHRLLASQAPSIIWLAIMLTVLTLSLVTDRHVPLVLKLSALLTYIVAWVLLPSLALFLGAIPFLRKPQAQT